MLEKRNLTLYRNYTYNNKSKIGQKRRERKKGRKEGRQTDRQSDRQTDRPIETAVNCLRVGHTRLLAVSSRSQEAALSSRFWRAGD